ncbi:hypothetical protein KIH39_18770 [Telmatocola sphagniphila]|jgi:hypothetical protein|uniref:Uncharacterized protein n=1 Tax=Telmatocola sphagniphila TaxID=1123043 RepID=A0A8E6EU33_9BACT|nr:hypothetical protein [Telmatocola sphagniphila]QVL30880.1 hypothetical protein KIH39_18770 [Telmatocola sphagniphila]
MSSILRPSPVAPSSSAPRAVPAAALPDSEKFLTELCDFLTKLDQEREILRQVELPADAERAVQTVYQLVDSIVEFANERFGINHRHEKLQATILEFYQDSNELLPSLRRRRFQRSLTSGEFAAQKGLIARVLNLFVEALYLQFEFFTSQLADRRHARIWVEAAAVFCVDVQRILRSYGLTETEVRRNSGHDE